MHYSSIGFFFSLFLVIRFFNAIASEEKKLSLCAAYDK